MFHNLVSWAMSERGISILRRTGLAIQAVCAVNAFWAYYSADKELEQAQKEVTQPSPTPTPATYCWTWLTYTSIIPGQRHQERSWTPSYRDDLPSETWESPTSPPGKGSEEGVAEHGCFIGDGGRRCDWQAVYGGSSYCGYQGVSWSVSRDFWGRRGGFEFVPLIVCRVHGCLFLLFGLEITMGAGMAVVLYAFILILSGIYYFPDSYETSDRYFKYFAWSIVVTLVLLSLYVIYLVKKILPIYAREPGGWCLIIVSLSLFDHWEGG